MKYKQMIIQKHLNLGELISNDCFSVVEKEVDKVNKNEVLLKIVCLSTSPGHQGFITPAEALHHTLPIGEVMQARGIGKVIESSHPKYSVGDLYFGFFGWQEYYLLNANDDKDARKIFLSKISDPILPLTKTASLLGVCGHTAYFGVTDIARPTDTDTVVISSAAGGVGCLSARVVRLIAPSAKIIGLTSTPQKCRWLIENVEVDYAINYRDDDYIARIKEIAPSGVNVYMDFVGGEMLNAMFNLIAERARIVIGGFISTNYKSDAVVNLSNYTRLIAKHASMNGYHTMHYLPRFEESDSQFRDWNQKGLIGNLEDIDNGLESMPMAIRSLMLGKNIGVKIVRLAEDH